MRGTVLASQFWATPNSRRSAAISSCSAAMSARPGVSLSGPSASRPTKNDAKLAVMLDVRFPLSLRNVENLLHERGIEVSHETVRFWWQRFGPRSVPTGGRLFDQ